VTRLLPLLLVAIAVGGCGSSSLDAVTPAPAGSAVAAAKPKHVRTLPKKVFLRRVNAICRRLEKVDVGAVPTITGDVGRNRRVFGAWFGRVHKVVRSTRRRLVRLGRPSRDRARWRRVMTKLRAIEDHIDTMRASTWAGSVNMLLLSARELESSDKSADRRLRRFGAKRCVS
jgi:hypothetical protein